MNLKIFQFFCWFTSLVSNLNYVTRAYYEQQTTSATNVSARFKEDVQSNKMKSALLCRAAFCIELFSLCL
jgi:hypothetical protein